MTFGVRLLGVGVGGRFWRVIETGDVCYRRSGHRPMSWPLEVENESHAVAH